MKLKHGLILVWGLYTICAQASSANDDPDALFQESLQKGVLKSPSLEKKRIRSLSVFNEEADVCHHLSGEVPYLFDTYGGTGQDVPLQTKKEMLRNLKKSCAKATKMLEHIRKKYPHNSSFEALVCAYELRSCRMP